MRRVVCLLCAWVVLASSLAFPWGVAHAWVPAVISLGLSFKPPGLPPGIPVPPRFPPTTPVALTTLLQVGMQLARVEVLNQALNVLNLVPKDAPDAEPMDAPAGVPKTSQTETAVAAFQQGRAGTWLTVHATQEAACTAAVTIYGAEQGWSGVTHANYTNCDSLSCYCTLNATSPPLSGYWPGLNGPQRRAVWAWPSDNTVATTRLSGSTAPTRNITACPGGTTEGPGGLCFPPAPTIYTADGVPSRVADNENWIPEPRDPDAAPGAVPSPLIIEGPDTTGAPTRVTFTPLPDGGISIQRQTQGSVGGQTIVGTDKVNIGPDGKVRDVQESIGSGTLQNPPATPSPTPATPVTVTNSTIKVELPNLPDDYNREVTQQSILTRLGLMLTELLKLSDTEGMPTPEELKAAGGDGDGKIGIGEGKALPDPGSDPSVYMPSAELVAEKADSDSEATKWLPGGGSCGVVSFPVPTGTIAIDFCNEWVEWLRGILAWVFAVTGLIYAWHRGNDLLTGKA